MGTSWIYKALLLSVCLAMVVFTSTTNSENYTGVSQYSLDTTSEVYESDTPEETTDDPESEVTLEATTEDYSSLNPSQTSNEYSTGTSKFYTTIDDAASTNQSQTSTEDFGNGSTPQTDTEDFSSTSPSQTTTEGYSITSQSQTETEGYSITSPSQTATEDYSITSPSQTETEDYSITSSSQTTTEGYSITSPSQTETEDSVSTSQSQTGTVRTVQPNTENIYGSTQLNTDWSFTLSVSVTEESSISSVSAIATTRSSGTPEPTSPLSSNPTNSLTADTSNTVESSMSTLMTTESSSPSDLITAVTFSSTDSASTVSSTDSTSPANGLTVVTASSTEPISGDSMLSSTHFTAESPGPSSTESFVTTIAHTAESLSSTEGNTFSLPSSNSQNTALSAITTEMVTDKTFSSPKPVTTYSQTLTGQVTVESSTITAGSSRPTNTLATSVEVSTVGVTNGSFKPTDSVSSDTSTTPEPFTLEQSTSTSISMASSNPTAVTLNSEAVSSETSKTFASTTAGSSAPTDQVTTQTYSPTTKGSLTPTELVTLESSRLPELSTADSASNVPVKTTSNVAPETSQTRETTTGLPSATNSPTTAEIPTTGTILATTTPTSVPRPCMNGGFDDGAKCVCRTNFYGTFCEFILNEIRPTIEASVDAAVTVRNVNFSAELQNFESPEYKVFEERFQEQMALVFEKIPNYQSVKILNITQGSVVVEYLVLLNVTPNEYDNVVASMATIIHGTDCTTNSIETLCFVQSKTKFEKTELNLTDVCSKTVDIPLEYQKFYTPRNISGVITCVSECSDNSETPRECNKGQCSVTLKGPHCYCKTSDQFWYTGDNCQNAISKPGVYAGVSVGVAVLLITIITLSVISYRRRHMSDKVKLIDKEKRWYEDGWEEDNQQGKLQSSSSSNQGSYGSQFRPHLDKVNTDLKMTVPRAMVMSDTLRWESRK